MDISRSHQNLTTSIKRTDGQWGLNSFIRVDINLK